MKKTYIKPEVQVVRIHHASPLLAGSFIEETDTQNIYEEEYTEDSGFTDL